MSIFATYVALCHLVLPLLGTDLKTFNLCITQSEESCNERMIERILNEFFNFKF